MNRKGVVLLPVVIVILIVLLVGYLIFQSIQANRMGERQQPSSNNSIQPTKTAEMMDDWDIDETNIFTSRDYGFSVKYPTSWLLSFEKYTDDPTYVLSAKDNTKDYYFQIYVAMKGLQRLPGPTGFTAGDWESGGLFPLLGQKLEKQYLIYEGKLQNVTYNSQQERSVIFPNTDTLFLFLIGGTSFDGGYDVPNAAITEFEQILSTFEFII